MEPSSIQITGGNPIFQGPITINVYNGEIKKNNRSTSPARQDDKSSEAVKGKGWLESDYYRPVTNAREIDFHDHISRPKDFYVISNYPKGRVLIVNNEFRGEGDERHGSNKDVSGMYHLWKEMGFSITIETDLTAYNMGLRVEEFAAQQGRSDICVVIIMSHGKEDDLVFGSKRGELAAEKVLNIITSSPSLKTKPKLIFFQMCRGSKVQTTHTDGEAFFTEDSTWINQLLRKVLPHGKRLGSEQTEVDALSSEYVEKTNDMMVAFATQPDCVALRDPKKGSWFIQSIRKVFTEKAAKHDVCALMEMVKDDLEKKSVHAPGTDLHEAVMNMDASDSFGKKRLMLFPGFPKCYEE